MESNPRGYGKQEARSAEQASDPSTKNVQDAALTSTKGLRKAGYERPQVTPIEKGVVNASDHVAATQFPKELSKTPPPSFPSLPPRDSPLTKAFLGQYLSLLVQETITDRKISYSALAQEMSIAEMILRDAVQGKLALKRGKWVKLGQLLNLATSFQLTPSDRNGTPCWELCYPPIPARIEKK